MKKHLHHIIPKHAGGTDDHENLISLTVEEHADAHRVLYEQYGRWQDYVAWKGLLGLITEQERMEIMYSARRGEGNFFYGKKHTEETRQKISQNRKGKGKGLKQSEEWIQKRVRHGEQNGMYGKEAWNKGKTGVQEKSLETKKKISKSVMFNGVEYYSIKEAARQNNTSVWYIKKVVNGHDSKTRKTKNTPKDLK